MKQRDDYLFKKILFFVFLAALALGAYVSLGSKLTSLIGTVGSINVMNLSGTFRVFMFIQFVALFFSISFLFYLTVTLVFGRLSNKKPRTKNLWYLARVCLSQVSVGGLILNISWICYFINKSLSKLSKRIQEKKISKNYFIDHITKAYLLIKREYIDFFSPSINYAFLKGFLSLLFWAILSLLLVIVIRWQAGTGGCEYCWRGDTQNKKEQEAKLLGYPIRRFVKIPKHQEFEYIDAVTDYVKYNSENHRIPEKRYASMLSDPKFKECKTCWRQFILALLLFYAFFLRLILSCCYLVLFMLSIKQQQRYKNAKPDSISERKPKKGRKPELVIGGTELAISHNEHSAEMAEPRLLLAFECGLGQHSSEIESLLGFSDSNVRFFGNILKEDHASFSETLTKDDFSKFLTNYGDNVSEVVLFIDLCWVPAQDYLLKLLYDNIFKWIPRVQRYWIVLSNGDNLRKNSQNNPLTVKQKVNDWKSNINDLVLKIPGRSDVNTCFIDWFDTEFHSAISEYRLRTNFQNELQNKYCFKRINKPVCNDLLFISAIDIILKQIGALSKDAKKIFINDGIFSSNDFDQILIHHIREGELQLRFLYSRISISNNCDSTTNFVSEVLTGAVDTLIRSSKDLSDTARDSFQSICEDPSVFGTQLRFIAKHFVSRVHNLQTKHKNQSYEIHLSNTLYNLGLRLTEYALALEFDGISIIEKTQHIHNALKLFSPSVLHYDQKNFEEALTQISEMIKVLKTKSLNINI